MARTTTVHLLTGDYADRLNDLWSAAKSALDDKTPRTALEADPYEELEAEYKALKAEAIEAGITVDLVAVGRRVWRDLKAKHPARTGDDVDAEVVKGDRLAGVNTDSVEDDLVQASLVSPEFKTRADFDDWADTLSEGEWQTLVQRAWELANGARLDPKELPSSLTRSDG
jgi:hypothetical protein